MSPLVTLLLLGVLWLLGLIVGMALEAKKIQHSFMFLLVSIVIFLIVYVELTQVSIHLGGGK